jgi:hypothetical protein
VHSLIYGERLCYRGPDLKLKRRIRLCPIYTNDLPRIRSRSSLDAIYGMRLNENTSKRSLELKKEVPNRGDGIGGTSIKI